MKNSSWKLPFSPKNKHMKNYFYLILLWFFGFSFNAKASDIFDFVTNKRYEIANYSKDFSSKKAYLRRSIEMDYQQIKSKDNSKINSINTQTFQLCTDFLENEIDYLALLREANMRVQVLNTLENSKNRYDGVEVKNPELKSIDLRIKSIINNRIFYEVNFLFLAEDSNDNNRDSYEIEISKYYIANILDGKTSSWKPILKPTNIKKIQDLVYADFLNAYLASTRKWTGTDFATNGFYGQKDAITTKNFLDLFIKMNLSKADYYWVANGLVVQFQNYSEGNLLYGGKFFNHFFPYEKALQIMQFIPEFSFINALPKNTTSIKNWSSFSIYSDKIGVITAEPQILDLIQNSNPSNKVKTLTQTNYQIMGSEKNYFQNKKVVELNANQKVVSAIDYTLENKIINAVYYDYDANGNIAHSSKKGSKNSQNHVFYEYDANNNIRSVVGLEENDFATTAYFYTQNFIFVSNHSVFSKSTLQNHNRYEINRKSYIIAEIEYLLDENQQIKGIISDKSQNYQTQIGRDSQGRIQETHREDDRYNCYFEYDSLDRITGYSMYEYSEEKQQISFLYRENERLPFQKNKSTYDGGNTTNLEEYYEWAFFD